MSTVIKLTGKQQREVEFLIMRQDIYQYKRHRIYDSYKKVQNNMSNHDLKHENILLYQ